MGLTLRKASAVVIPPDTIGDVGPNHYVETTNVAIKVFDKSGNTLLASVSFDTFFGPLGGTTPCGTGLNQGDPYSFYDHLADRWVVSDFGFASFGGNPSYECVAVSQTSDPVAGGWFLYAVLVDPTDANDYPKAAMWSDPQPGGAYHFTYNMWASLVGPFTGVKVQALDRAAMIAGQQNPTVIEFKIPLAGVGASYSLVPAGFRTGDPPPAGRDEMLLAVDSPVNENTPLTQVHGWLFHVDFANPGKFNGRPRRQPHSECRDDSQSIRRSVDKCRRLYNRAAAGNGRKAGYSWRQNHDACGLSEPQRHGITVG